jgi:Ni,Fe-hydrogenase maturation factor
MLIYIFGNPDHPQDNLAIKISQKIKTKLPEIEFIYIKPNEDLPFINQDKVVIMDVVAGIDKVTIFTQDDLDKLVLPPRTSAHDYDLAFQLKYLKKLGKLKEIKIIGLPIGGKFDLNIVSGLIKKLIT